MQEKYNRRSNEERSRATRDALIAAARKLFVSKGYTETATPEIVAEAKVTRGALYYHFSDKTGLFRAVLAREFEQVADAIDAASSGSRDAIAALREGGAAFIGAMQDKGRARLILQEGPAVLGQDEMDALDRTTSARTLEQGLEAAMREGRLCLLPLAELTSVLSAMFDRAALEVSRGGDAKTYLAVIDTIVGGLRS